MTPTTTSQPIWITNIFVQGIKNFKTKDELGPISKELSPYENYENLNSWVPIIIIADDLPESIPYILEVPIKNKEARKTPYDI